MWAPRLLGMAVCPYLFGSWQLAVTLVICPLLCVATRTEHSWQACQPSHPILQMSKLRIRGITGLSQSRRGAGPLVTACYLGFSVSEMGAVIGPWLPGSSHKALCNVNMKADNGEMFIAEAIEAPWMAGGQSGGFSLGCHLWPQGLLFLEFFCMWHITFELLRAWTSSERNRKAFTCCQVAGRALSLATVPMALNCSVAAVQAGS